MYALGWVLRVLTVAEAKVVKAAEREDVDGARHSLGNGGLVGLVVDARRRGRLVHLEELLDELGRYPAVGADHAAALRVRVVAKFESLAQAKVGYHGIDLAAMVGKRDEHIVRLDVPVNDVERVQMIEALGRLLHYVEQHAYRFRLLLLLLLLL